MKTTRRTIARVALCIVLALAAASCAAKPQGWAVVTDKGTSPMTVAIINGQPYFSGPYYYMTLRVCPTEDEVRHGSPRCVLNTYDPDADRYSRVNIGQVLSPNAINDLWG